MKMVRLEGVGAFAKALVETLLPAKGATVLALSGELGAGKTTLVQAIGRVLGVAHKIPSPTFLVMRSYETTHPRFSKLIHIDAYRMEDPKELKVLGFAALLADEKNLICIEWPERLGPALPENATRVKLEDAGEGVRAITICA